MRRQSNTILFWGGVLAWLLLTHFFMGRLFAWPLVLSLILTYTISRSWYFLALTAVGVELFSQLPPGVMSVALFTPWLFLRIPGRPSPDLSILFSLYVVLISSVQVLVLYVGLLWFNVSLSESLSVDALWAYVPANAGWVVFTTAATSLIAIIVWYELVAPYRVTRTVPRFKI